MAYVNILDPTDHGVSGSKLLEFVLGKTVDQIAPHGPGRVWSMCPSAPDSNVESFWISTGVVALAEMGDKTQLLALILAARFKKPLPIIIGILFATVLNHGLAGALGAWITTNVDSDWLRWGLGLSFIAMGIWALVPDKFESEQAQINRQLGVFGSTFILFFIAEIGDKTQLATVALAAHYPSAVSVVLGTTLGMLIANVPAVLFGNKILARIPMRSLRWSAAAIFIAMGVWVLFGSDFVALV